VRGERQHWQLVIYHEAAGAWRQGQQEPGHITHSKSIKKPSLTCDDNFSILLNIYLFWLVF
jgi:hypothetical protein